MFCFGVFEIKPLQGWTYNSLDTTSPDTKVLSRNLQCQWNHWGNPAIRTTTLFMSIRHVYSGKLAKQTSIFMKDGTQVMHLECDRQRNKKDQKISDLESSTWNCYEELQRDFKNKTVFKVQRIESPDYAWLGRATQLAENAMEGANTHVSMNAIIKWRISSAQQIANLHT